METIREYLKDFMRRRGLVLGDLADAMNYRSKTSLMRLMDDDVRPATLTDFRERMISSYDLSEQERMQLNRVVRIRELGPDEYHAFQAMGQFVEPRLIVPDPQPALPAHPDWGNALLAHLTDAQDLTVTLFNSLQSGIIEAISTLLGRSGTHVRHCLMMVDSPLVMLDALNLISPILFHKRYTLSITLPTGSPLDYMPNGLARGDAAYLTYKGLSGKTVTELITFTADGLHISTDSFQPMPDLSHCVDVKSKYPEQTRIADYIPYSRFYMDLERNHCMWKLKADIGVDSISSDILYQAILEGPAGSESGLSDVLERLRKMYANRFRNTFEKKKHAYTVMNRQSMLEFARTGRTSDHFWLMRPFTPAERVSILQNMLEHQRNNKYVHYLFLADDSIVPQAEYGLYENRGLLVQPGNTGYNLSEDYDDVLLTSRVIRDAYQRYFMRVIVHENTLPEAESEAFLQQLIDVAGGMENA